MKTLVRLMLGASALAVAGCAQLPGASLGKTFYAEDYLAADHGGSGFTGALASEYTGLARSQADMVRWMNATAYITKAEQAEAGSAPAPWTPEELGVNGEASAKYNETVAIIQENADARPEACARAQAMWDQYLFLLRAEANGAKCPMTSEDGLAMLNEALAACAPAGAAPGDFVVYFGFNRTDLTTRARAVIGDAADAYDTTQPSAVSVVGHADTVGSVEYNQTLSENRARRVAAALSDLGVPQGAMTLAGRSELEPAVQTADGVREPLNRRVEITFSE
jgi:outer membrane protein OmpA-like peptidoglycan-associated protein